MVRRPLKERNYSRLQVEMNRRNSNEGACKNRGQRGFADPLFSHQDGAGTDGATLTQVVVSETTGHYFSEEYAYHSSKFPAKGLSSSAATVQLDQSRCRLLAVECAPYE